MPINIDGSKGIRQNTTEVTKIPVGTTAQRPANPEVGMMRFNTDTGQIEGYNDVRDIWLPVSQFPAVIATGGTVTDIEQDGKKFRVHTFTSDGTFEVARGGEVEYLVVGGGGSGGSTNGTSGNFGGGGGGGAGGLITGTISIAAQTHSINVGSGGLGQDGTTNPGQNSSAFGLEAVGGGGGGHHTARDGQNGGSGGGPSRNNAPGTGVVGQGNDGGTGTSLQGGGGGGAGRNGQNAIDGDSAGDGGVGIKSNITGIITGYAGGGGGGGASGASGPQTPGGQSFDGGGAGGSDSDGNAATPNTAGGGGGHGGRSDGSASLGGDGGSGIVIVRYRIG